MDFRKIIKHTPKAQNIPCSRCKCFTTDLNSNSFNPLAGEAYTTFPLPYLCQDAYPDLPVLKTSESAGCTLCGALRSFLFSPDAGSPAAGTTVEIRATFPNYRARNFKPSSVKFEFLLALEKSQTWKQLTFLLAAPSDSPAAAHFPCIREPTPLGKNSQIQTWFKECEKQHTHCKTTALQPLPTRLIDVSCSDPKLVPTNSQVGKYAALSHCWGLSVTNPYSAQYLLKKSTLSGLMQRMPFSEMPKTFQDAVAITRLLGLQYLWIDSLCIIQDSPPDVAHEIKNMVSVYGSAWVTICATQATNSHAGFLGLETPSPPQHESGTYNFYIRKSYEYITGSWSLDIESSAWNKRAWTYQERLVSRRMLHFGKNGTYFECLSSDSSEAGTAARETVFEAPTGRGPEYRHLGFYEYFSSQEPVDLPRVYETYYWFVNEYSQRQLNFEGDREAAFSALVAQFAKLLGSECVHGLWMDDVHRGLLWRPIDQTKLGSLDHRKGPKPLSKWPSWSWLSSVYRSTWSCAHLWVLPLQLQLNPPRDNPKIIREEGMPTQLILKAVLVPAKIRLRETASQYAIAMVGDEECGEVWFDESDAHAYAGVGKGWYLQLGERDLGVSAAQFRNSASGIFISPTERTDARDQYKRVGFFKIESVVGWKTLFEGQVESVVTLV